MQTKSAQQQAQPVVNVVAVPCPICGAAPEHPCNLQNGSYTRHGSALVHQARFDLAVSREVVAPRKDGPPVALPLNRKPPLAILGEGQHEIDQVVTFGGQHASPAELAHVASALKDTLPMPAEQPEHADGEQGK